MGAPPKVAPSFELDVSRHAKGAAAEAWALMGEIFFALGRPKIMRANQDLGLSPPQGIVIRFLDRPRPMGELATMMNCDNSNMTGIVDRLEEHGIVQRTPAPGDRRVKLIELTERGGEVRDELGRRMAEPPDAFKKLSRADQVALREIFERVSDNA